MWKFKFPMLNFIRKTHFRISRILFCIKGGSKCKLKFCGLSSIRKFYFQISAHLPGTCDPIYVEASYAGCTQLP